MSHRARMNVDSYFYCDRAASMCYHKQNCLMNTIRVCHRITISDIERGWDEQTVSFSRKNGNRFWKGEGIGISSQSLSAGLGRVLPFSEKWARLAVGG